jgi:hypothetical protein
VSQTLYIPGTPTTVATLLPEISNVRAIVPTSDATGGTPANSWEEWHGFDYNGNGDNSDDFIDSSWYTNAAGTINGVGYDNNFAAGAVDYQPYFSIRWNTAAYFNGAGSPPSLSPVNLNNVMFAGTINGTAYAGNQSCFMRYRFTVTPADLAIMNTPGNTLYLQMRYDDGFVAWINGTELTTARPNAPVAAAIAPKYPYYVAATATNADANAIVYFSYDITSFASSIHAGTNILAIQGLNQGLGSSDLLIQPKITVGGNSVSQPPYTPNLSAGATQYTGPITINAPTQIIARTLHPLLASDPPTASGGGTGVFPNGSSWSAPTVLYFFPGAVSASQATIQISEVNYHPLPPNAAEIAAGFTNSNDFEFIRLTNTGNQPVDLTGIYFSNGLEFTAVPGLQNWLPAGQSVVVVENTAAFQMRYGNQFTILGEFNGELDDGGEHIVLNDKTGAVISDFIYGDSAPWPDRADAGYSLVFLGGSPANPASWMASLDPGGTQVNSFANWQNRHFGPRDTPAGLRTANADADGDGYSNLIEYVLVSDPLNASDYPVPTPAAGNPGLVARQRTGVTDATVSFEHSTALDSWAGVASPESSTPNSNGTSTVVWRITGLPGNRQFMRLRASMP